VTLLTGMSYITRFGVAEYPFIFNKSRKFESHPLRHLTWDSYSMEQERVALAYPLLRIMGPDSLPK